MSEIYDHEFTDAEWDAANDAAARCATYGGHSHPHESIESLRQLYLGAIAFAGYCDRHLADDLWSWDFDVTNQQLPDSDTFADPLHFGIGERRVRVFAATDGTPVDPIHPLLLRCIANTVLADRSPPADTHIQTFIDADEAWATVYAAFDPSETQPAMDDLYGGDYDATADEWERDLALGDDLPPHFTPLSDLHEW